MSAVRPMNSKFFAESLLVKPSVEAPAIRPANPKNDQFPNRRPSQAPTVRRRPDLSL
jgi:hypothetical protein